MQTLICLVGSVLVVGYVVGCTPVELTVERKALTDRSADLREVHLACANYATDHEGAMPTKADLIGPYSVQDVDLDLIEILDVGNLHEVDNPHEVMLLRSQWVSLERERAVAYVDGHVEILKNQ